jgi:hypothetical protein
MAQAGKNGLSSISRGSRNAAKRLGAEPKPRYDPGKM